MTHARKTRKKKRLSVRLRRLLRRRLIAGLLVVVPLGFTAFILNFLYAFTAGRLSPVVKRLFGQLPDYAVAAVSVVVLVLGLYLVGLVASVLVGRRLIALFEGLLRRIPLVATVYGASRQIVDTLSFQGQGANFKSVVVVDFPYPGMKSLAFVTGMIGVEGDRDHYKLFVPTTPNPTSGYFELTPPELVHHTNLSIEDAIKAIASGGFIIPEMLIMEDGGAAAPESEEGAVPGC